MSRVVVLKIEASRWKLWLSWGWFVTVMSSGDSVIPVWQILYQRENNKSSFRLKSKCRLHLMVCEFLLLDVSNITKDLKTSAGRKPAVVQCSAFINSEIINLLLIYLDKCVFIKIIPHAKSCPS